jgi:hypothetical protein
MDGYTTVTAPPSYTYKPSLAHSVHICIHCCCHVVLPLDGLYPEPQAVQDCTYPSTHVTQGIMVVTQVLVMHPGVLIEQVSLLLRQTTRQLKL